MPSLNSNTWPPSVQTPKPRYEWQMWKKQLIRYEKDRSGGVFTEDQLIASNITTLEQAIHAATEFQQLKKDIAKGHKWKPPPPTPLYAIPDMENWARGYWVHDGPKATIS